jgi:hypothetical protein
MNGALRAITRRHLPVSGIVMKEGAVSFTVSLASGILNSISISTEFKQVAMLFTLCFKCISASRIFYL